MSREVTMPTKLPPTNPVSTDKILDYIVRDRKKDCCEGQKNFKRLKSPDHTKITR